MTRQSYSPNGKSETFRLILFQWFSMEFRNSKLLADTALVRAITMRSRGSKLCCFSLKFSRTNRFNLFRPTALRTCFREIANPSRAWGKWFLLTWSEKYWSENRFEFAKTFLKSGRQSKRWVLGKRNLPECNSIIHWVAIDPWPVVHWSHVSPLWFAFLLWTHGF